MTATELRKLDAEIHIKVMGLRAEFGRHSQYEVENETDRHIWEREDWWAVEAEPTPPGNNRRCLPVPRYSTDISAAWKVVEALCGPDYRACRIDWAAGQCGCSFVTVHAGSWLGHAGAETVPLAICRAALVVLNRAAQQSAIHAS